MLSYFFGQRSLRVRVRRWLALFVFLTTCVLVLGISLFVYQAEQWAWHNRQQEAAHIAALTVENFMARIDKYMQLIGLLDRALLTSHPDVLSSLLAQEQALLEIIRLDAGFKGCSNRASEVEVCFQR